MECFGSGAHGLVIYHVWRDTGEYEPLLLDKVGRDILDLAVGVDLSLHRFLHSESMSQSKLKNHRGNKDLG